MTGTGNTGRDSIRAILRQHRRAYFALNIAYYGLVIAAMLFVSTQPELQRSLLETINVSYNQTLPLVVQACESGNFPLAAGLTFLINFAPSSSVVIAYEDNNYPVGGFPESAVLASGYDDPSKFGKITIWTEDYVRIIMILGASLAVVAIGVVALTRRRVAPPRLHLLETDKVARSIGVCLRIAGPRLNIMILLLLSSACMPFCLHFLTDMRL
jgi:hypothetical protein